MKKTILIVDDDVELAEELKDIFEVEGFGVTIATDGFKASELIEKAAYDIALLDIKIPGSDGVKLNARIKERNPLTKVFLISGMPFLDKLIEKDGRAVGIAGFFNKPFDVEKMVNEIKK